MIDSFFYKIKLKKNIFKSFNLLLQKTSKRVSKYHNESLFWFLNRFKINLWDKKKTKSYGNSNYRSEIAIESSRTSLVHTIASKQNTMLFGIHKRNIAIVLKIRRRRRLATRERHLTATLLDQTSLVPFVVAATSRTAELTLAGLEHST